MTARAPTTTLVTGPVRSGKSRHAEHLLWQHREVLYVATGRSIAEDDPEWAQRVVQHRERRPEGWRTVETTGVAEAIAHADSPVLVDCLGTWLTALVDAIGWDDLASAQAEVRRAGGELVESLCAARVPIVIVTNEVGWSLVPLTASGRFFQDELGRLNAAVSAVSGVVHLVVAGRVLDLGAAPLVSDRPPPRTLDA
jgi:adenosylcobinamide kinase/adenosylcobinamide-phosphate guanylyltransferase